MLERTVLYSSQYNLESFVNVELFFAFDMGLGIISISMCFLYCAPGSL